MYSLLVDTATDRGVVAVGFNDSVIASAELKGAKDLAKVAHALCDSAGISPSDLAYCIVGVGPGSYTGIRVAVSFAKGLAVALGIPLVPISGLYGLLPDKDGTFVSVLDAKVGGVFMVEGVLRGGRPEWHTDPMRMETDEFQVRLESLESPIDSLVVIDYGWVGPKQIKFEASLTTTAPRADALMRLGFRDWNNGRAVRPEQLAILYLRKTQAEIEKNKNNKTALTS